MKHWKMIFPFSFLSYVLLHLSLSPLHPSLISYIYIPVYLFPFLPTRVFFGLGLGVGGFGGLGGFLGQVWQLGDVHGRVFILWITVKKQFCFSLCGKNEHLLILFPLCL